MGQGRYKQMDQGRYKQVDQGRYEQMDQEWSRRELVLIITEHLFAKAPTTNAITESLLSLGWNKLRLAI